MSRHARPNELGRSEAEMRVPDLPRQLGLVLAALTATGTAGAIPPAMRDPVEPDESRQHEDTPTATLDDLPRLISVGKAATVLGISCASAYRYASSGDLPTVRLGGRLYVVTARLKAFLDAA